VIGLGWAFWCYGYDYLFALLIVLLTGWQLHLKVASLGMMISQRGGRVSNQCILDDASKPCLQPS
jgi:energy-converting hydrogenase Eha subunit G